MLKFGFYKTQSGIWWCCLEQLYQGKSDLLIKHVQIEATRTVTGIIVNYFKIILYSELNLETLQSRRDEYKLIIFYKIINGLAPQDMLDWILTEHPYNIRSNELFSYLPLYTYYNSFAPSTCKLWNNLRAEKKISSTLSFF